MNIEFDDNDINVKDIMRQIKENVSKRNIEDDLLNNVVVKEQNITFAELEGHQFILNKLWNYPTDYPITSHRRFIGRFLVFLKKAIRKCLRWYINPIAEKQIEFNAFSVRALNTLVDELKQMNSEIKKSKQEIADLKKARLELEENIVQVLKNEIIEIKQFKEHAVTSHSEDNKETENVNIIEEFKQYQHTLINEIIEPLSRKYEQSKREMQTLQQTTRVAVERLRRIERKYRASQQFEEAGNATSSVKLTNTFSTEDELDFDYFLFEEYYRGSREQIKEKQKQYLKYFKEHDYVLDLGCGRGEFTELLLENGIKVTSVDLNDDMVEYCQDRGFPVVKQDIIGFLNTIEDHSANGIFLGQVIEHLPANVLIELVNLSYRKLKPNGWFIAETPNPQCMSVFTQSFYMDLTHVKPVHAYTAKFILESAGFLDVKIEYFSPNDEFLRLPRIELEGIRSSSLDQFNATIEHWNNTIFGNQDYYVAGRK